MRQFYLGILTIALLLALPLALQAQGLDNEARTMELPPGNTKTQQNTNSEKAQEVRQEALQKANDARANVQKNREEIQKQIMQRREEKKELFAEQRDDFRLKLQSISDEKKQQIVEKIDSRIADMNERVTTRLAAHLDKINSIIDRIEEKSEDIGGEKETLTNAISAARAAVEASQTAVAEQAGKEYLIEITDETTLGADVSTLVLQFKNDIRATIETVKTARQKTVEAARELAALSIPISPEPDTTQETEIETESVTTDEVGG